MMQLRRYRAQDAPWVAAFLRDVHRLDPRFDGPEDDAFADFVAQPENREGVDFVVATDEEGIAAVLLSGRLAELESGRVVRTFKVIVHPRSRELGLEALLIERVEGQDETNSAVWRTVFDAELTALSDALFGRGYRHRQTILHLRRMGVPPAIDVLAQELRLRDADPAQDSAGAAQLYNRAHRDAFGFSPISAAELVAMVGARGGRWMVLTHQDAVIGSVRTLPFYGGVGVLQGLEIEPDWQGRGLGKYLATVAISALAQHGFRTVEVAVDAENDPAVRLYRALGFETFRRDLTFEGNPQA